MTGWQEVYKNNLSNKTITELKQLIKTKENTIKRADKRTHNGKMIKIFETADILAIKELIQEKEQQQEKELNELITSKSKKLIKLYNCYNLVYPKNILDIKCEFLMLDKFNKYINNITIEQLKAL